MSMKGKNNPNYKTGWADKENKGLNKLMNSYNNMKQRCLNKNHPKFHRYGGRGVNIHTDWMKPKSFFDWAMDNGWKAGLTIDRIDNDGNYSPDNCQWISCHQNSRKKSTTKLSIGDAETIRLRASNGEFLHKIASDYNVVHGTVWFVVNKYTHVEDGECTNALKGRDKF